MNRLVVASVNPLVRLGFEQLSAEQLPFNEIHYASTKEEVHQFMIHHQSRIVVDSDDFVFNYAFLEELQQKAVTPVVVICSEGDTSFTRKCIDMEVPGLLSKSCDVDELYECFHATGKGNRFFCNKILDVIISKTEREPSCEATHLTERELDVLNLLGAGHSNKTAAEELSISPHTVHSHRKNLMKKLGTNSIGELISEAHRLHLIG